MPKRISFSYLPFDIIDPKSLKKTGEIFRPYVVIRLSLGHGKITSPIDALVDSGADRNLFPYGIGEILGINFKRISPLIIYGIGESKLEAYPAKINIWVASTKYEVGVDFSPVQQTPLLGRNGFFNLFESVTFIENKRFLDIEI